MPIIYSGETFREEHGAACWAAGQMSWAGRGLIFDVLRYPSVEKLLPAPHLSYGSDQELGAGGVTRRPLVISVRAKSWDESAVKTMLSLPTYNWAGCF